MRNTAFGDRKVCLLNALPNGVTGSRVYFLLKIVAVPTLGNHRKAERGRPKGVEHNISHYSISLELLYYYYNHALTLVRKSPITTIKCARVTFC